MTRASVFLHLTGLAFWVGAQFPSRCAQSSIRNPSLLRFLTSISSQPALRSHWQTGHGAFSISESQIDKVAAYTEVEEAHHSRVSFQDEFRTCFEKIRDQ